MKLSDIENKNSKKLNNRMRDQLGWNINLESLNARKASAMMESIDNKLSSVRASHKIHVSEKDPNYMGMIMAKQVLESFIAEAELKVKEKGAKPDYIDIDGDGDKTEPMKKAVKDKGKNKIAETAKSKSQQQAAGAALAAKRGDAPKGGLKGASKEMAKMSEKELKKIAGTKHKGLPKKKVSESRLFEDELSQAQAMLAAKDMVDSMQDMIEDISRMLNEELPPLTDTIRASIGDAEADSFKASASSTLNSLLTTVQSSREAMDQAVRTLSGQPAPIATPSAPAGDLEIGGGEEAPDLDAMDDEFGASDAAVGGELPLGREKR